jgi:putative endonuclease
MSSDQWCVYIVKCNDGTFYTGCTNDLNKRIATHNLGKGAKYTRARLPIILVYTEIQNNVSDSLKRENVIKKLTRQQKIKLISDNPS